MQLFESFFRVTELSYHVFSFFMKGLMFESFHIINKC